MNIDVSKLKIMAKKLKEELLSLGKEISLVESYEIVSRQIGFKDYNTALELIKKEKIKKENIIYTFYFKEKEIKKSLKLKINKAIEKLYFLNKIFNYELSVYDELIVLNLFPLPNDIDEDETIIEVMLISFFKEDLLKNNLTVEKREILIRDEITDINKSLLN